MYQKTERFNTVLEALIFIMKLTKVEELQVQDRYSSELTTHSLKEIEMTDKAVSTITLVYGKDSRLVSDDEIFSHIKRLEDEVVDLNKIANKPKKLKVKVELVEQDIQALVSLVDNR